MSPRPARRDNVSVSVRAIEREAATGIRQARKATSAALASLGKAFREQERIIRGIERDKINEIERWKYSAIAAVDSSRPVSLSDIRAVKRETTDGASVSVAQVTFLDGSREKGATA